MFEKQERRKIQIHSINTCACLYIHVYIWCQSMWKALKALMTLRTWVLPGWRHGCSCEQAGSLAMPKRENWDTWGHHLLFSCSVMSNSLWPYGLQHARLPCPSSTPRACSNHVHWVSDATQPSYPLSSPSPSAFSLSHQGLFQWVGSSHQVAKVLELQLQHQSFQWIFRIDFL